MDKLVLIGAGGHSKVIIDVLKSKYQIVGITDIDKAKHNMDFYGVRVLGGDEALPDIYRDGVRNALITLGSIGNPEARRRLYRKAVDMGFDLINAISEKAIISESVIMGQGNSILEQVIIHADTVLGNNTILNTACIIEHDCIIKDNVHISPGARLAGGVKVGEGSHIGLGANVIQGITIGDNCIIGAGAVVIEDVPDNSTYVGVPAKRINVYKR